MPHLSSSPYGIILLWAVGFQGHSGNDLLEGTSLTAQALHLTDVCQVRIVLKHLAGNVATVRNLMRESDPEIWPRARQGGGVGSTVTWAVLRAGLRPQKSSEFALQDRIHPLTALLIDNKDYVWAMSACEPAASQRHKYLATWSPGLQLLGNQAQASITTSDQLDRHRAVARNTTITLEWRSPSYSASSNWAKAQGPLRRSNGRFSNVRCAPALCDQAIA
jgi:hypothetical protein